jgi:hypothetical protein
MQLQQTFTIRDRVSHQLVVQVTALLLASKFRLHSHHLTRSELIFFPTFQFPFAFTCLIWSLLSIRLSSLHYFNPKVH